MDKVRPELQMYEHKKDENIKHADGFNRLKYVSIQDKVNNDPLFAQTYMNQLTDRGWVILANHNDIKNPLMRGRHFKYRLNGKSLSNAETGTFRSGGMIIGMGDDNDPNYILYKAYNGCIFSLQLSDIEVIYVRNPNLAGIRESRKEQVIKSTVYFKYPENVTEFPVTLPSIYTGEDIVIYYAKDKYNAARFKKTKKFQYAESTRDWEVV